jgi:serine phosphatase RsbU (regulator of sigma subunit)/catechol 2,3-dioxygenase-like lactoylglutathione lyase family enzyme
MANQPDANDSTQPHLRIQSVTIYVRDQDRSTRFYVNKLEFTLAFDVRLESGSRWVGFSPPDGFTVLVVVAPEATSEEYGRIGRTTGIMFVTEDVAATWRLWSDRGVPFQHAPRESDWGGTFTVFADDDGNEFALVSFDAVTREIEEQRRAAAARLEAERRAAQELDIAKQVQARLFPQSRPACRTLDYSGICKQARQVGGDYYDFLNLGEDRIGLVIGDIAGKGIAGALLMANLQANLRGQCAVAWSQPRRLLQLVNRLFYENTANSAYATLFFAEYDDRAQCLRFVNCGHLCGLLFRGGNEIERLDATGTVLGLFSEWDGEIGECHLQPGDTLVLYTDGVTEAINDAGEEFGEDRLIAAVRRRAGESGEALSRAIVREIEAFSSVEQYDDVTLIVARCVQG